MNTNGSSGVWSWKGARGELPRCLPKGDGGGSSWGAESRGDVPAGERAKAGGREASWKGVEAGGHGTKAAKVKWFVLSWVS